MRGGRSCWPPSAALAEGSSSPNALTAKATQGKLAYLFTGQGAQEAGMGKGLHQAYPTYASALDEVCAELDPHLGRSLKDLLFAEPGSTEAALLDQTTYTQPALFATEVALFRLLESFGLKPDLLSGHSIGEIAAAHLSGVFDLTDACRLVAARGALMGALPPGGAMVAIEATEAERRRVSSGQEQALSIAAINAPGSVVLSGAEGAVEEVQADWQAKDARTKRLTVSHAFHSPLMEPMLDRFAEVAKSLTYSEPQIPIVSNLSGEILKRRAGNRPLLLGLPRQGAGALCRRHRHPPPTRHLHLPGAGTGGRAHRDGLRVPGGPRGTTHLHPHPQRGKGRAGGDDHCPLPDPRFRGKAQLERLLQGHRGKAGLPADLSVSEEAVLAGVNGRRR